VIGSLRRSRLLVYWSIAGPPYRLNFPKFLSFFAFSQDDSEHRNVNLLASRVRDGDFCRFFLTDSFLSLRAVMYRTQSPMRIFPWLLCHFFSPA